MHTSNVNNNFLIDIIYTMRSALLPLYVSERYSVGRALTWLFSVVAYSRLILHSFSFQQAFVRGITVNDKPVLLKVTLISL